MCSVVMIGYAPVVWCVVLIEVVQEVACYVMH